MMKKIVVAVMTVIAAAVCHAQTMAPAKQSGMMIEGRPFFTDAGVYNNYDLFNSPLGVFDTDTDTTKVDAELGYRYHGLDGGSRHYPGGRFRAGDPGRAFFEIFYGPDIMKRKYDPPMADAGLTLHRFGLTAATQSTSGAIRSALSLDGYVGGQTWEGDNAAKRLWGGLEKLRLDMGSQVNDFVRIGLYINFTFHYDSLHVPPSGARVDVSTQTNLPEFGVNLDFGGSDIPIRSNASFSYAFGRFVHSHSAGNSNAIRNDSLRLTWLTHGAFPVMDGLTVKPGLMLGFSNNAGKECEPDPDDNYPHLIGSAIPNRDYTLGGFYFGAGAGAEIFNYANAHVEYSLALMSLTAGNMHAPPPVKSRTLHHTAFGVSTPLHKYVDLPLSVTPRIAYFISGSAGIVDPVYSDLRMVNTAPGRSKQYLYTPGTFLAGFARTSGFTFGVDGLALEGRVPAGFWMTFLSKDDGGDKSKSGMELGVSVGYRL